MQENTAKRVGIYSGTFDPIHEGHLAFALKALEAKKLDKIFFLVEPRPRRKQGVRALEHREAMVRLAIADNPRFGMIVLEHASFSVEETLPKLMSLFEGAELHMLMGEDVLMHVHSWPHVEELLRAVSFVVGIRRGDNDKVHQYLETIQKTRGIKFAVELIVTDRQDISSSKIRASLKHNNKPAGLPVKLLPYIKENGLYTANGE